ncbi:MAG: TnsA endonuclease N-terminal domain-containing protein [Sediminibacterium sp.]
MATYKGFFRPTNIGKYEGDFKNIVYRSLWERQVFRWCDENSQVIKWSSEEVVIPYYYPLDKKYHRYFVDLKFTTAQGVFLIEIKPKAQTLPPKKPSRQTKRFLTEAHTYVKNQCKWKAAEEYAKDRGWTFAIWTEDTIKSMGIKIL